MWGTMLIYMEKKVILENIINVDWFSTKQHLTLKSFVLQSTCRQIPPRCQGRRRILDFSRVQWKSGCTSQKRYASVPLCHWRCHLCLPYRSSGLFLSVPGDTCSAPAYIWGSSRLPSKKTRHGSRCLVPFKSGQEWGTGLGPQLAPEVYG